MHIICQDNDYAREDLKVDTDNLPTLIMIMDLSLERKLE